MSETKLGYWKVRGLVEPIRYLLYYKNIKFENKRYEFDNSWIKEKFTLDLDFPNLPYYIDENVKLTQSITILRYLARKYDLEGKTDEEQLRASLAEQQLLDLRGKFYALCTDTEFETKREEYVKQLPDQLKLLANFLGDRKFLAGDNLTYVDFIAYETLDFHFYLSKTFLDELPALKAYYNRIKNLPGLRDYTSSSSFVRWPLLGPTAIFGGKGEEPK